MPESSVTSQVIYHGWCTSCGFRHSVYEEDNEEGEKRARKEIADMHRISTTCQNCTLLMRQQTR